MLRISYHRLQHSLHLSISPPPHLQRSFSRSRSLALSLSRSLARALSLSLSLSHIHTRAHTHTYTHAQARTHTPHTHLHSAETPVPQPRASSCSLACCHECWWPTPCAASLHRLSTVFHEWCLLSSQASGFTHFGRLVFQHMQTGIQMFSAQQLATLADGRSAGQRRV